MEKSFQMSIRKSITGAHITLSGDFSHKHAEDFSALIQDAQTDNGRIFIDVRKLSPVNEEHSNLFKQCYAHIPPRNVIFKGMQGTTLGHIGNRILSMKDHACKCAGACKSCACEKRVQNRNERFEFLKKISTEG